MDVSQPYSDDLFRAYQSQGGRLSFEEILSRTLDDLY